MSPPSSVLSHPGDSQPLSSFLLFHVGSKILAPHRACEGRSSPLPPMALYRTLEVLLLVGVLPTIFRACACDKDQGLRKWRLSRFQQNVSFWNPINRNQPLGKWLKTRIARGLHFEGCSTQAGLFHHLCIAFPPNCLL